MIRGVILLFCVWRKLVAVMVVDLKVEGECFLGDVLYVMSA